MPDGSAISPRVDTETVLPDGRRLGWCEWGNPDGVPLLRLQGTPGSRLSRHPDPGMWSALGLRVITIDRPGFGTSTPLEGRGFREVAYDIVELLDQLGLDSVFVYGQSGGAPHTLALAALQPTRVRKVAIAVGAAPITAEEADRLLAINRAGWEAARKGRAAVVEYLQPHRDAMLADPIGGFRAAMVDAPDGDRQILEDPIWQQGFARGLVEALNAGIDGWADETMAMVGDWDFDVRHVRCRVDWYHGPHDVNSPISAVRRLLDAIPDATLTIWPEAGHMVAFRHERDVLERLIR